MEAIALPSFADRLTARRASFLEELEAARAATAAYEARREAREAEGARLLHELQQALPEGLRVVLRDACGGQVALVHASGCGRSDEVGIGPLDEPWTVRARIAEDRFVEEVLELEHRASAFAERRRARMAAHSLEREQRAAERLAEQERAAKIRREHLLAAWAFGLLAAVGATSLLLGGSLILGVGWLAGGSFGFGYFFRAMRG